MTATHGVLHFNDMPDVLLSKIFSLVSDTRTRNVISLVCRKWCKLERSTRTSLTLRGNIRDLYLIPDCFKAITNLDLSLLSPWGHPLLDSSNQALFLARLLGNSFPAVVSLTIYVRNPSTLYFLAPQWPNLSHVKLVRWHPRFNAPPGSDFLPLFEHCHSLASLDLSQFYCWTEDVQPALEAYPTIAASLFHLNVLSISEGFKSNDLLDITSSCPNLRELLATCIFDHRFIGFVGDETLISIASNCPRLSLLHLVDTTSSSTTWADRDDDGYAPEDAMIRHTALGDFFTGLPLLEEVVLDVCNNVRDTWPALELLNSKCPRLKSLKLGHFHGICRAIDSSPDGVALCRGLGSLSIKNCADLTDSGLIAISLGCSKLTKFEIQGCKRITETGMWNFSHILRRTLIDVKISFCKNLNAVSSLKALEPIQDQIQRLHIDCVWESVKLLEGEASSSSALPSVKLLEGEASSSSALPAEFNNFQNEKRSLISEETSSNKKMKHSDGNGGDFCTKIWANLQYLSLCIAVGELLIPLPLAGLEECPMLEEVHIKIVGDCRHQPRPLLPAFGLSSLVCYPQLSKMKLDCGDIIGFALTAPVGHIDLSMWERFYLKGIDGLNLKELNYWPPQDMDVNQRTLSLPAAGLLAQCRNLRTLIVHGTANEHFMKFFLKIPPLRNVQLREDYYPAPENETTTEMRVDSCARFEDALNRRQIPD
ncbi:F-box/LRR-repeat MAX2 homolog A-like [Mangifera indica]|uniref:F-box/LRR-repeat MAX2 homolog A-like n=1 Tax=Mangifera indica TaxID=29780 RepID=UPI001CFBC61E|nr:F-box/LRR-repeat MAX2 homolog A-like [Mangifera indica]